MSTSSVCGKTHPTSAQRNLRIPLRLPAAISFNLARLLSVSKGITGTLNWILVSCDLRTLTQAISCGSMAVIFIQLEYIIFVPMPYHVLVFVVDFSCRTLLTPRKVVQAMRYLPIFQLRRTGQEFAEHKHTSESAPTHNNPCTMSVEAKRAAC